ncbi:hypothetical protein [Chitinophaga cymbidii]|uniref:Lipocalin-like domain-containing protein n=1 Tax=Chitinophaga cymbidii TaxID=1096750 RepID=A0A512RTA6_9BACT|nr:hypothetical protein [Chitinophaga cymbidii]GEP98929.1 hypothetical protein CCY01nite_51890 [Chitinophaga cymbidii]
MKFAHPVYILATLALTFTSCTAEETEPDSKLLGTYDLLYMTLKMNTTITSDTSEGRKKTIYLYDYATQENTGTFTIRPDRIFADSIGYRINTIVKVSDYYNDVAENTQELEMIPPPFEGITMSGTYQLIGEDSLYASSGLISTYNTANPARIGMPYGTRFFWSGDTLTFYHRTDTLQHLDAPGNPRTRRSVALFSTRYLKRK